ncbi:hypothetical protein AB6T85_00800 [Erwinia sp. ACCC 02193]|uniref:Ead/Ea22-like family protein n=1 Tax=Erwinia aeris TaxID=3239803 RepID=A0ABV4E273_9GAMM
MTEYYVSGVIEIEGTCGRVTDEDAEFFTLYGKDDQGLSQCIADFTDRLSAEAAMQVYQERDALQQQVNALAAEVECMREQSEVVYAAGYNHGHLHTVDGIAYAPGVKDDFYHSALQVMAEVETPATDAIKRQWMAEGVEQFAAFWESRCRHNDTFVGGEASNYAAQLRQPEEKGQ